MREGQRLGIVHVHRAEGCLDNLLPRYLSSTREMLHLLVSLLMLAFQLQDRRQFFTSDPDCRVYY